MTPPRKWRRRKCARCGKTPKTYSTRARFICTNCRRSAPIGTRYNDEGWLVRVTISSTWHP